MRQIIQGPVYNLSARAFVSSTRLPDQPCIGVLYTSPFSPLRFYCTSLEVGLTVFQQWQTKRLLSILLMLENQWDEKIMDVQCQTLTGQ